MGEIISAGVDWMTISSVSGGLRDSLDVLGTTVSEYIQSGFDTVSAKWPGGYEGWAVGPIRWLEKGEAQLLVVSGHTAGEYCDEIWHSSPPGAKITRLDLQVTISDAMVTGDDMLDAMSAELARLSENSSGNSRRKMADWRSGQEGRTLYWGSRNSKQYARFYRKLTTSLEMWPPYTWRWEVEFKKPVADRVWEMIGEKTIPDIVRTWFVMRNLPVDWPAGADVPLRNLVQVEQPDFERKLEWIRRQVRPFVLHTAERDRLLDFLKAAGIAASPVIAKQASDILRALLK